MKISKSTLKGTLCVIGAGMCWGTTGTIQAFAPEGASSLSIGAARVAVAGIILFIYMLIKKRGGLLRGEWSVKGVMLVLGGNRGALSVSALGVFLAFGAALSYALEGVGLRLIKRDPYDVIAVVSAVSGLMALPWLLAGDIGWMLEPRGAACMGLLTFLSTIIPYTLFTIGIQNIALGTVYTLSLSEPLTAWFLSAVLLGERLSWIGSLGVGILFCGILLLACNKNQG